MPTYGRWLSSMAMVACAACQPGDRDARLTASAGTTASDSDTGGTEGGGESGDIFFDVAGGDLSGADDGGSDSSCHRVDFLFVIDDSGSMEDNQANLIANWPGFISGIQATLTEVNDYQVGIVTTDEYASNAEMPGCQALSGLVVETGGSYSSNAACGPYVNGLNFMTEADDLTASFQCAARVGTDGSDTERPMQAMVETVQTSPDNPGMCNEGFLRPDSLLVIVVLTDEGDRPHDIPKSAGDPARWFNDVVTARGGIEENVVVLSLIQFMGGPCAPPYDGYDGESIKQFTEMFTNGFVGGICEPSFAPYFAEAIEVIESACSNYTPPG